MPEESFLVGKPLRWSYETGQWYEEAVDGKNKVQCDIDDDEEFAVDVRSYSEVWQLWQDRKPTHRVGGRRIDGWINCPRDQLPDQDRDKWPLRDDEPSDPWVNSYQVTLVRLSDDKFFTWSAQYGATRGSASSSTRWARRPSIIPA